MPTTRRRVIHLADAFVQPSEVWLYDLVTLPVGWRSEVVCASRLQIDEFPFGPVHAILPPQRRLSPEWWTRRLDRRVRLPLRLQNDWRRSLRRARLDADLFHAHFGSVGWRATDAGLRPVVTSFYGYDATERPTIEAWGRRYLALFRDGAAFLVEGPAMGRRLQALGAPPSKIRIVPLIADTDELVWRAPILRSRVRVVMAGRFVEKKGFDHGVAAFASAFASGQAELTLTGDGPLRPHLVRLADELGVSDRIHFRPFQGRGAYRQLLNESDILLQPSRTAANGDSEGGAPTTLLDAQALGLVIVASNHADIPFVLDGQATYSFPEGDVDAATAALRRAAASSDEWLDRSRAARRHVEAQHSRAAVAARLAAIYSEAAGDRPA